MEVGCIPRGPDWEASDAGQAGAPTQRATVSTGRGAPERKPVALLKGSQDPGRPAKSGPAGHTLSVSSRKPSSMAKSGLG